MAKPRPLPWIVSIIPYINLSDVVTLLVFKDPAHRSFAGFSGADQGDRDVSARRRAQPLALLIAQIVDRTHLQPRAILETDINAIHWGSSFNAVLKSGIAGPVKVL